MTEIDLLILQPTMPRIGRSVEGPSDAQVALRRTWDRIRLALSFLTDDESDQNLKADAAAELSASLDAVSVFSHAAFEAGVVAEAVDTAVQQACETIEHAIPELLQNEVARTTPSQMMTLHLGLTSATVAKPCAPGKGRPAFSPEVKDMEYLVSLAYDSPRIAEMYGVSHQTVQRWLRTHGLGKRKRAQVADTDLRSLMERVTSGVGANWGWRMVYGNLRQQGVVVTQDRVQTLLRDLHPCANETRRLLLLAQRTNYKSRGPNAVWHVNGNHKLAPWGIYIHGAIDGGTKYVLYLNATDCNTAAAACQPYMAACELHQGCSRVRIDAGSENRAIAEYQLAVRGENRGSVLVGPSFRNQPIERLWRDVRRSALEYFRVIFRHLEKVDHSWRAHSSRDRHCLRAVFLPVVQQCLNQFIGAWNNHNIRNAGVPANRYEPCCRWELLDNHDWDALRDLGFSIVPEGLSQLSGIFGAASDERRHQAADPVRLGRVLGFTAQEAALVFEATEQVLGPLHPGSSSTQMIQFYMHYRRLVTDLTDDAAWPVAQ